MGAQLSLDFKTKQAITKVVESFESFKCSVTNLSTLLVLGCLCTYTYPNLLHLCTMEWSSPWPLQVRCQVSPTRQAKRCTQHNNGQDHSMTLRSSMVDSRDFGNYYVSKIITTPKKIVIQNVCRHFGNHNAHWPIMLRNLTRNNTFRILKNCMGFNSQKSNEHIYFYIYLFIYLKI